MSLIHDSEREDFVQCIVAAGLSVDDFELTEQRDESGPKEQHARTGRVTVTYKPTGITCSYHAGHVSAWLMEFEHDLKRKAFQTR